MVAHVLLLVNALLWGVFEIPVPPGNDVICVTITEEQSPPPTEAPSDWNELKREPPAPQMTPIPDSPLLDQEESISASNAASDTAPMSLPPVNDDESLDDLARESIPSIADDSVPEPQVDDESGPTSASNPPPTLQAVDPVPPLTAPPIRTEEPLTLPNDSQRLVDNKWTATERLPSESTDLIEPPDADPGWQHHDATTSDESPNSPAKPADQSAVPQIAMTDGSPVEHRPKTLVPAKDPPMFIPPPRYRQRVAENRDEILMQRGGSSDTEAAVQRALKWLADHQATDGRWDADAHGSGRGHMVDGQQRGPAGLHADTGITGLAVLAFLGSGHSHEQGKYRDVVHRAIDFLQKSQAPDGNLCGPATSFARMYCHGIASMAINEAYAMTNDAQLMPTAQKALRYSLSAQHPVTGGWRYHPGGKGDTSQLGWQVMAISAAEEGGFQIPTSAKAGMRRFLNTVSQGSHRGLASYRPGHVATAAMTAEALACRLVLQHVSAATYQEAAQFICRTLPGSGPDNLYYWYYATLGLSRRDSPSWRRWNAALTTRLLDTQVTSGAEAGSWPCKTVWGDHGGRVYSTALSALCLEVYYRFP